MFGGNVLDIDYTRAQISDSPPLILVNKETETFLRVIGNDDFYILNVLRGFLRICLTAREEGRYWQSGVWVYGPPATSKSVWAELLKKIIDPDQIAEFSRTQNQFTANQLVNKKLLIVSDLVYLGKQHVDVIKRILGRDTITMEKKFDPTIGVIEPSCQVLIISNEAPTQMPLIAGDQAILDKLIVVEYPPESKIPQNLQTPELARLIVPYLVDIVNWALSCPKAVLRNHIRALEYNRYRSQTRLGLNVLNGLEGFLQACFWYKPGAFTPINDIRTILEKYIETTGDDSLTASKKESPNTQLAAKIQTCFGDKFGVSIIYQRLTRAGYRPYGFPDIIARDPKDPTPPSGAHAFQPLTLSETMTLLDPFHAVKPIEWLSLETTSFQNYQAMILEHRKNLKGGQPPESTEPQSLPFPKGKRKPSPSTTSETQFSQDSNSDSSSGANPKDSTNMVNQKEQDPSYQRLVNLFDKEFYSNFS